MNAKQAIIQTSKPRLVIKRYSEAISAFESIGERAVDAANENLLSYSWQLSVSDTQGSFTMSFFPAKTIYGEELFDCLEVMDVVEVYEEVLGGGDSLLNLQAKANAKSTPAFVGVIRSKKYAAQMSDSGVTRRVQVSGISAAGLIAQLYLDFNVTLMAIKDTLGADMGVSEKLTTELMNYTNAEGKAAGRNTLKSVVGHIWSTYKELAAASMGNVDNRVVAMIDALGVKFDFDQSTIEYPLANLIVAESTQNIFNIAQSIAPSPVYETFATMLDGVPCVKVRMVPFAADDWAELAGEGWEIEAVDCKAFDLAQSDETVYTVFFTYLDGYPEEDARLQTIAALMKKGGSISEANSYDGLVKINEEKYALYGYRLLNASFRGYGKEDEITNPREMMEGMNENMMLWFGSLDEMYHGSVTLAMTGSTSLITPGSVVSFLGGEFYVEGVAHSWEYGRGGDVNLSLTRGGKYTSGSFAAFSDLTAQTALLEGLSSKAGETSL